MRVILVGSKSFGFETLKLIHSLGHDVVGIWSPDDPHDKLTKRARQDPVWIEPQWRTANLVESAKADLIVAAHSHDFIDSSVRGATRYGAIGYHPSLLPRHRGRDAIRWTIHMDDPIAGGTVYWLTDRIDAGPIAAQDWCFVPPAWRDQSNAIDERDGASMLWRQELFPMGIRLLARVLVDIDNGRAAYRPQEELNATWEPSWQRPPLKDLSVDGQDLKRKGVEIGVTK